MSNKSNYKLEKSKQIYLGHKVEVMRSEVLIIEILILWFIYFLIFVFWNFIKHNGIIPK